MCLHMKYGGPANKIKNRFPLDLTKKLEQSVWWDLPEEELKSLVSSFENPEEFLREINK